MFAALIPHWLMKLHRHRRTGKPRLPQQGGDPGNRVLESTSARGKIRGTARQLVERYLQFAEEARLANDRVASEAFLQSAEHYVRLGNPVCPVEIRPARVRPPAPAPIETEAGTDPEAALLEDASAAINTEHTPEPEAAVLETAPRLPETSGQEQARIAERRAAAGAELVRVAGQHGYTLAQLGLVLRTR